VNALGFANCVLQETHFATSPRSFVRGMANAVCKLVPIECCQIRHHSDCWTVVAAGHPGFWHDAEAAPQCLAITENLAIATPSTIPVLLQQPELLTVILRIIDSTLHRLTALARLAAISRISIDAKRELQADLKRSELTLGKDVRSQSMRIVHQRIAMVAGFATTVLIEGESGTGKERAANHIHQLSNRSHRPMQRINCAAIADTLLESELFGHERGAFTGAERRHAGAFERAHQSTLFLDEVAELSPIAQAKLLRVLQDGQVRRLGGSSEIKVDVRVVAASNRSLRQLTARGLFREDLLYRLDVFNLTLPPLRERIDDLAPLAQNIIEQLATSLRIPKPRLHRTALEQLTAHQWPGNIRELHNVLEAAMIVNHSGDITLGPEFTRALAAAPATGATSLDAGTKLLIERTLNETNGRIYGARGAAIRLGLPPGTLQSKMVKLGIDRKRFIKV
jgi:transcriptional regulator with GAF, ATPase, and Fis domain